MELVHDGLIDFSNHGGVCVVEIERPVAEGQVVWWMGFNDDKKSARAADSGSRVLRSMNPLQALPAGVMRAVVRRKLTAAHRVRLASCETVYGST